MPTLWNDLTTDEPAQRAGLAHRSAIITRIRLGRQPATKAKFKRTRYRYWITEDELALALAVWPRNAKKARDHKPGAMRPKTNARRK